MSVAARAGLAALVAGVACVHHGAASEPTPHIDRIRPDTVTVPYDALAEVTIVGRGFAPGTPGANTIEFAGAKLAAVPANAAGTEIRLTIPNTIPSNSEAPPMRLPGGVYTVRVITGAGTSNAASVTVVR